MTKKETDQFILDNLEHLRCDKRGNGYRIRLSAKTPKSKIDRKVSKKYTDKRNGSVYHTMKFGRDTNRVAGIIISLKDFVAKREASGVTKASTFHRVQDWRTLKQAGPRPRRDPKAKPDVMVTQQTRDRISAAVKQEGGYVETERAFNEFIAESDAALGLLKLHHGNPDQLVFNLATKKFFYREIKDHGASTSPEQRMMFEALEALGITVEVWERDAPTKRKVAA